MHNYCLNFDTFNKHTDLATLTKEFGANCNSASIKKDADYFPSGFRTVKKIYFMTQAKCIEKFLRKLKFISFING